MNMYKAIVIKKIVDDNGVEFFEGNRVRLQMKPTDPNRPLLANEYIGEIKEISSDTFILDFDQFCFWKSSGSWKLIEVDKVDRIRLAKNGETLYNTENFDD